MDSASAVALGAHALPRRTNCVRMQPGAGSQTFPAWRSHHPFTHQRPPARRFSKAFLAQAYTRVQDSSGFCEVYVPSLCSSLDGCTLRDLPEHRLGGFKYVCLHATCQFAIHVALGSSLLAWVMVRQSPGAHQPAFTSTACIVLQVHLESGGPELRAT